MKRHLSLFVGAAAAVTALDGCIPMTAPTDVRACQTGAIVVVLRDAAGQYVRTDTAYWREIPHRRASGLEAGWTCQDKAA